MALKRTKKIEKIMSDIDNAKVFFEELHEKRQDSFDNKSDKWKEGDAGTEEEENLSELEEVKDACEELYGKIESLFEEG